MATTPVIAVFDLGKTNKKLFLFDELYKIVWEKSAALEEITDEDGFPCEDLSALIQFIREAWREAISQARYSVRALNFSAYGASFVHLDAKGEPIAPLYNYLKPYPNALLEKFYTSYGPASAFSRTTASPSLGSLNSGLQLYRLKYEQPELFQRVQHSLHLPQFLSFLFTRQPCSGITSIGCHTALWDFGRKDYHSWVGAECVDQKLPPIFLSDAKIRSNVDDHPIPCGVGLHDSSAALVPYLMNFKEPFILISTGTWNISLNPFNRLPLEKEELEQDCLCYLDFRGQQVKASRLFAGYEHEQAIKKLAEQFAVPPDHYKSIPFDESALPQPGLDKGKKDFSGFPDYTTAYHFFMAGIVERQRHSTSLLLNGEPVKRIFVDGGFSRNTIFMQLLAKSFPQLEVYAATVAQASALGAALALHETWTDKPVPADLIALKYYKAGL